MSAEQPRFTITPILRFLKEKWHREVINQFDPISVFEKFEHDISIYGLAEARQRRKDLLESNLKTYVQEATGMRTVFPYATRVTLAKLISGLGVSDRLVFQNAQYRDVELEQAKRLEREPSPQLRTHYQKEHELWLSVWHQLVDDIASLVGQTDSGKITTALLEQGAKTTHLNLPDATAPKSINFNMDPLGGLRSLFPALRLAETIEIIELPKKLIFASPSFAFYHDGETTLGRHVRLVYLPQINEFVILAEGLYTGYRDEDIAKLHLLGEQPKIPASKEELFWYVQALATEYGNLPPQAVFEHLINLIGHFDAPSVGEGVVTTDLLQRDLSTQVEYLESIFEYEHHQLLKDPKRSKRLAVLLKQPTQQVMHSALRGQILNVKELLLAYQESFHTLSSDLRPSDQAFAKRALVINPDFATRVVSLVDCGTGTILGTPRLGSQSLETVLGRQNFNQLLSLDLSQKGITNQQDLLEFCRTFGLDNPARFSQIGTCAMCGKQTLIWPREMGGCNVCPVCEVKDNLGIHGDLNSLDQDNSGWENFDPGTTNSLRQTRVSVSQWCSALFNPGILKEV